ncbi:Raffinose synthase or seed inhibition protein Sip1 [Stieleria bergensis]|uniref:Raffinose synthase or seed inhibition protein Sip1 n=2 Tax=Stieleria bergensis TaxID=2528025 RepID=A0A517SWP6_9BACT|nr:Raffinose synthase or seed inhibition protein Sip1 [Planctomycetes bacterium SV_7m_r]
MGTFTLKVPEFSRGVYYSSQWWPYAGNRVIGHPVTTPVGDEGGKFLLLQLSDDRYLAVLPLSGDAAYSWFAPDGNDFILKFGTHGKAAIEGDFPLVAWARGATPYEACSKVWASAAKTPQIQGHMKLRAAKDYPEMFRYLGWCSWEEFHKNITSDLLVDQLKGLAASPAPVRYFLVDDGHFNNQTLTPKSATFPQGYQPLTALREDDGIRWVGMWHALMGENKAVRAPGQLGEISKHMMTTRNNKRIAKPNAEDAEAFLDFLFSFSKRDDIDFVKVDFYGGLLPFYAGTDENSVVATFPEDNTHAIDNPAEATVTYARIYHEIVEKQFNGLINCNWHQPQFLFNSGNSSVGRCSADYSKGNLEKAKNHLYDSYAAIPWLGQIAWGDHDMFHSNDPFAGRMMAVSKALSGAPVYLSDPYDHLEMENIKPLCYEDGLLLRPLAPAAPLPEDIFQPMQAERLHRVMAPLANQALSVAIYNFHGDAEEDNPEFSTTIVPADYAAGGGMIQPYSGVWEQPAEGLLVYDFYRETAQEIADGYDVSIEGFGDRLLQLSPIENGWAVIGRTDKYLPAAAVELIESTEKSLQVKLHETGPFGLWLAKGKPVSGGIEFIARGNGFFVANLSVKAEPIVLTIKKVQD